MLPHMHCQSSSKIGCPARISRRVHLETCDSALRSCGLRISSYDDGLLRLRFDAQKEHLDRMLGGRSRQLSGRMDSMSSIGSISALTAVGELSSEQRTVLKEHGLAWVLFLTPEAQVRTSTRSHELICMMQAKRMPCHLCQLPSMSKAGVNIVTEAPQFRDDRVWKLAPSVHCKSCALPFFQCWLSPMTRFKLESC